MIFLSFLFPRIRTVLLFHKEGDLGRDWRNDATLDSPSLEVAQSSALLPLSFFEAPCRAFSRYYQPSPPYSYYRRNAEQL